MKPNEPRNVGQKPYFLEFPTYLFYCSCFISLFFVLIVSHFNDISFNRTEALDRLTFWFDPLLLHLAAILILSFVIVRYRRFREKDLLSSVVFGFLGPVAILFFELLLEKAWLEATFDYPVALAGLPDSPGTSYVVKLLDIPYASSIPSGFCIRQTWLLLFTLGIIKNIEIRCIQVRKNMSDVLSNGLVRILTYSSLLFLILIIFLRVYRGHSNFLDIGIALGVGTFLFWFLIIIYNSAVAIVFKHEAWQKGKEYITFFSGYIALIVCSFYFYSHEATQWVFSSLIIFLLIAICYIASSWILEKPWVHRKE